jgi:Exopolysaccharide biosynthesis protein YbjH
LKLIKKNQAPRVRGFFYVIMVFCCYYNACYAQTGLYGVSGVGETPDARVLSDGNLGFTMSKQNPYTTYAITLGLYDRAEVNARITNIQGVPGFPGDSNSSESYGSYKDKSIDYKIVVLREGEYLPQITFGQDDLLGTKIFNSQYLVLGKFFYNFDLNYGVGSGRLNGNFYSYKFNLFKDEQEGLSLLATKNNINYKNDFYSDLSGINEKKNSISYGFEYRKYWFKFGVLTNAENEIGAHLTLSIPLNQKEYFPKTENPQLKSINKFKEIESPVETSPNGSLNRDLNEADKLQYEAEFKKLGFEYFELTINKNTKNIRLKFENTKISQLSEQIDSALRIILFNEKINAKTLDIEVSLYGAEILNYQFNNIKEIRNRIYNQKSYADIISIEKRKITNASIVGSGVNLDVEELKVQNNKLKTYIGPGLSMYMNDPSSFFHYTLGLNAGFNWRPVENYEISADFTKTLYTDISQVQQQSNSLLPHVRSDIASYKSEKNPKINKFLINNYKKIGSNFYSRSSVGLYEEMFMGLGAQLAYLPINSGLSADISVDSLQQRDYRGLLGAREYRAVTSIFSLQYDILKDLRIGLRVGKFLAGDEGHRIEIRRKFKSGIEIGAWYTRTNAYDTVTIGGERYYDKGIIFSIPLAPLSVVDTQMILEGSIAPWTRDVGQMVKSPSDITRQIKRYYEMANEN